VRRRAGFLERRRAAQRLADALVRGLARVEQMTEAPTVETFTAALGVTTGDLDVPLADDIRARLDEQARRFQITTLKLVPRVIALGMSNER
jgi:hypothetical protein